MGCLAAIPLFFMEIFQIYFKRKRVCKANSALTFGRLAA